MLGCMIRLCSALLVRVFASYKVLALLDLKAIYSQSIESLFLGRVNHECIPKYQQHLFAQH